MQYRDITILPINAQEHIVIACDGCAGIGEKEYDVLAAPPELVGAYCVRVPLLELLAFGAEIISIVQVVGNEYESTARRMQCGIQEELAKANLATVASTGSTEENMKPGTTSVAVTVIGKMKADSYRLGAVMPGAVAFRIGEPLVGEEILQQAQNMVTYAMIRDLRKDTDVMEIVPLGSRGTLYECEEIARYSQLCFVLDCSSKVSPSLHKSGGPATAAVVVVRPEAAERILVAFPQCVRLGYFEKNEISSLQDN